MKAFNLALVLMLLITADATAQETEGEPHYDGPMKSISFFVYRHVVKREGDETLICNAYPDDSRIVSGDCSSTGTTTAKWETPQDYVASVLGEYAVLKEIESVNKNLKLTVQAPPESIEALQQYWEKDRPAAYLTENLAWKFIGLLLVLVIAIGYTFLPYPPVRATRDTTPEPDVDALIREVQTRRQALSPAKKNLKPTPIAKVVKPAKKPEISYTKRRVNLD
ncbi:MAG: hypothetical protein C9356_15130 [Oleiphilus sp.]|nr:MAG: hypothetical protein C9356_15130 [Oleiphilus sp.]